MILTAVFGQQQEERIIRFHADIVIDTTGRIEVTEHIKVYAGGIDIKRGIERDIPRYRKDSDGKRVRMETNILAVRCNGEKVTFATRDDSDHTILRIGSADVLLVAGEYDYTIVYESFGHIGFFDGYDELYWNVTGNGWVFPIERASPAEVSYLHTRAYREKALSATFVDMAVNRAMTIRCEEKKKYAFINKMDTAQLRPVEQQMYNALFAGGRRKVDVVQENHTIFSQADTFLKNSLTNRWDIKDYFIENRKYTVRAGIILLVVLGLYTLFSFSDGDVMMAFCVASPLVGAAVVRLWSVGDFDLSGGVLLAILTVPFMLMTGALLLHFDSSFEANIHWLSAFFYAMMSAGYLWYVSRVRMFTPEGARLASEIEGLRMYMKTAEEHRLNMLAPPEHTLELFEKLLPYALVLGVSNEWCKKFDDVLSRIDYRLDWYDSRDGFRTVRFAATFTGLSTSVGNAKTEKTSYSSGSGSWSSGSSGGGRSGGSGGGGGGRGW